MAKFYYALGHEQYQPELLVQHARLAEDAGFDGLLIAEHFHPWVEDDAAADYAFSTLGAIAEATDRVALMTAVTTPLFRYHPAVVAQAAGTIDRLSGGRFALGVGMGRAHDEVPAGFAYPPYKERNARMREAIEVMRRLLDGEKLTYRGEYYQTKNAKLYSPPIGDVPILMAAGGPKSATLAGEMADGLIVSVKDVEETKERLVDVARYASKREMTIVAMRWTIFAENDDVAWQALGALRGLRAPDRETQTNPMVSQQQVDAMPRDEVLSKYTVASDAEAIVENYRPLIENLGADIVGLQVASVNPEETIRMLGQHVLPVLRAVS